MYSGLGWIINLQGRIEQFSTFHPTTRIVFDKYTNALSDDAGQIVLIIGRYFFLIDLPELVL